MDATYLTCLESRGETCTLTNLNDIYDLKIPVNRPFNVKNVVCLNSAPKYFPSIIFEAYRRTERFTAINCTITAFVTHPAPPFTKASQLKELNLSRNSIRYLVANIFRGAMRLQTIDLSYNQIESLDPNIFGALRYLTHLNLSYNQLWGLNLLFHVQKPLQMIAAFNQITTLTIQTKNYLPKDMNLHVDVRNNRISRLYINPNVPVKSLLLDNNLLSHISSIARIKRLIRHSLYNNPIFSPEFTKQPYTSRTNFPRALYIQTSDKGISPVTAPPSNCTGNFEKAYCLNKGVCWNFVIDYKITLLSCQCPDGYQGERCEEKSLSGTYIPNSRNPGGYPGIRKY